MTAVIDDNGIGIGIGGGMDGTWNKIGMQDWAFEMRLDLLVLVAYDGWERHMVDWMVGCCRSVVAC